MIAFRHAGHRVRIRKNEGHPEQYLWITIDDREFFLGVLVPGMRRRDVRALAQRWIAEHPQHFPARQSAGRSPA